MRKNRRGQQQLRGKNATVSTPPVTDLPGKSPHYPRKSWKPTTFWFMHRRDPGWRSGMPVSPILWRLSVEYQSGRRARRHHVHPRHHGRNRREPQYRASPGAQRHQQRQDSPQRRGRVRRTRRHREQNEMAEAATIFNVHRLHNAPFDLKANGFDLAIDQIKAYVHRTNLCNPSYSRNGRERPPQGRVTQASAYDIGRTKGKQARCDTNANENCALPRVAGFSLASGGPSYSHVIHIGLTQTNCPSSCSPRT
jgi:hypothetical protein